MEPVGQLHQDHAKILHHGEQHLADALGLPLLAVRHVELAQLGDAVDAARDLVAKLVADLIDGRGGVFHHVVEQAGFQAHHIHAHVGKLAGDQQGMHHVRLAGATLLVLCGGLRRNGRLFRGAPDPRQAASRGCD